MSETSKTIDDSGSAFPSGYSIGPDGCHSEPLDYGMSRRQYAAIHLRVPDSGTDWLDEMIREALRDENARAALIGVLSARNGFLVDCGFDNAPEWAYKIADAMLQARNRKGDE